MSFPAQQSTGNLSSDPQPSINDSANRGARFELTRGPLSDSQQYYTKVSEPQDSTIYICENTQLAAIRVASSVFRNLLQEQSRDSILVQTGTVELLITVLEGAYQYITGAQQHINKMRTSKSADTATIHGLRSQLHFLQPRFEKASNDITALESENSALGSENTELEKKCMLYESEKIDTENRNYLLQIEIERMNKKLKAGAENLSREEADIRGKPMNKRRRGEISIDSHTEDGDEACNGRDIYLSD